jgi:deoxyhypusine synthase
MMADFFLNIAYYAEESDIQLQKFAVTRAVDFIFDDEKLELIAKWIIAFIEGKVEIRGKVLAMPISAELGYSIIRKAFKCQSLNEEDHEMMQDTVFKR